MQERKPGMWTWLLQRLTALYIFFGLVVHFYLHHFLMKPGNEAVTGERFFTAQQIAERLSSDKPMLGFSATGWAVFYLLLLFSCAYHGFFGVVKVVEDHVTDPKVVKAMNWAAWLLTALMMAVGIAVYRSLAGGSLFTLAQGGM